MHFSEDLLVGEYKLARSLLFQNGVVGSFARSMCVLVRTSPFHGLVVVQGCGQNVSGQNT